MADRVLLATANHPPWSEQMARELVGIEAADTMVSILYVFDEADRESTQRNLNLEGRIVDVEKLAARKEVVLEATSVLEEAGLEYEVLAEVNDDGAEAILDVAADLQADRIYVPGERRNPVGKAVFGSDLQDVIRWSNVPVVVSPVGAY